MQLRTNIVQGNQHLVSDIRRTWSMEPDQYYQHAPRGQSTEPNDLGFITWCSMGTFPFPFLFSYSAAGSWSGILVPSIRLPILVAEFLYSVYSVYSDIFAIFCLFYSFWNKWRWPHQGKQPQADMAGTLYSIFWTKIKTGLAWFLLNPIKLYGILFSCLFCNKQNKPRWPPEMQILKMPGPHLFLFCSKNVLGGGGGLVL